MVNVPAGLALLNLFTSDMLVPSEKEYEEVYQAEKRLIKNVFEYPNWLVDDPPKKFPVTVIPLISIIHIFGFDYDQGLLSFSASFTFSWMDERLSWKPENYSGLSYLTTRSVTHMEMLTWLPIIYVSDAPGDREARNIFDYPDLEILVEHSGTVRVTIEGAVDVPCATSFSDFPHDFINCTLTMKSPVFADKFRFADWGGFEFTRFLDTDHPVVRVQDLEVIGIDSQMYYIFWGMPITDEMSNYEPSSLKSLARYNIILKRSNKYIYYQVGLPLIATAVLLAGGVAINTPFGLSVIVYLLGIQMVHSHFSVKLFPHDQDGMPMIAALSLFLIVETSVLIAWRVFVEQVRRKKNVDHLFPINASDRENHPDVKFLNIVNQIDQIVMAVVFVLSIVSVYIALKHS